MKIQSSHTSTFQIYEIDDNDDEDDDEKEDHDKNSNVNHDNQNSKLDSPSTFNELILSCTVQNTS